MKDQRSKPALNLEQNTFMSCLNLAVGRETLQSLLSHLKQSFHSKNQNLHKNICCPFCLFTEVGLQFLVQYSYLVFQYSFGWTTN